MIIDKLASQHIRNWSKNRLASNQHRAREDHSINTAKIELLLEAKVQWLNKAILLDISQAFDNMKRHKLKEQISIFSKGSKELENSLYNILIIYDSINYEITGEKI